MLDVQERLQLTESVLQGLLSVLRIASAADPCRSVEGSDAYCVHSSVTGLCEWGWVCVRVAAGRHLGRDSGGASARWSEKVSVVARVATRGKGAAIAVSGVVRDGQLCDCVCARGRGESMPLQHACVVGSRWVLRRCGEVTELGWVGSQVHLFGCMFRSACVRSRELRVSAKLRFWYWLGCSARGKDKACQVSSCGCVYWVPRCASRVWVERD